MAKLVESFPAFLAFIFRRPDMDTHNMGLQANATFVAFHAHEAVEVFQGVGKFTVSSILRQSSGLHTTAGA